MSAEQELARQIVREAPGLDPGDALAFARYRIYGNAKPEPQQLPGMTQVLNDIANEIAADYPFQANSLRNMAALLSDASPG